MGGLCSRGSKEPEPRDPSGTPLERAEDHRKTGNVLCNKGAFSDACIDYDKSLEILEGVKTDGAEEEEKLYETKLSIHLNLALTHLRRANIYCTAADNGSMPAFTVAYKRSLFLAIEHGDSALAMDPKSEKGFLRRGLAHHRLAEMKGYDEHAKLAVADLQKVLEISPESKEALRNMKQREEADAKREIEKNIERLIRPDVGGSPPIISVEHVHFHVEEKPMLADVCLDLKAGRCVGLVGDDDSGRPWLISLFSGKASPSKGRVVHHGKVTPPPGTSVSTATWIICSCVCALLYFVALIGKDPWVVLSLIDDTLTWVHFTVVGAWVFIMFMSVKLAIDYHYGKKMRYTISHVTCESSHTEDIASTKSVQQIIGEKLPPHIPRSRVDAMLKAAGLQDIPVSCGELSPEQKQAVHVLRCLATCPDVLICDEALFGVEEKQQARILHMIRRMKEECGTAVLYNSSSVEQLRLITDNLGYVSEGCLVELGPTPEVLDSPRSPSTKECLAKCAGTGGKVGKEFAALAKDAAILGEWLPQ